MNSDHTRVVEIQVKSALNKVKSAQYPDMRWSLNPYRGCKHGCVYCYARYTHTFFELDPDRDFATVIFVKRNLPEALRSDLRKLGWPRPRISRAECAPARARGPAQLVSVTGALTGWLVFRTPLPPASSGPMRRARSAYAPAAHGCR